MARKSIKKGFKFYLKRGCFSCVFLTVLLVVGLEILFRIAGDYLDPDEMIMRDHNKMQIVCIGDSYTAGIGADNIITQSYPAWLQGLYDDKYPDVYQVINSGIPGNNSSQIYNRITGAGDYLSSLAFYQPRILIFMGGMNNVWHLDGNRLFTLSEYRRNPDTLDAITQSEIWLIENSRFARFIQMVARGNPADQVHDIGDVDRVPFVWEGKITSIHTFYTDDYEINLSLDHNRHLVWDGEYEEKLLGLTGLEEVVRTLKDLGQSYLPLSGEIGVFKVGMGINPLPELQDIADQLTDEQFDELRLALFKWYLTHELHNEAAQIVKWTLENRSVLTLTTSEFIYFLRAGIYEWLDRFPELKNAYESFQRMVQEDPLYQRVFEASPALPNWAGLILKEDLEDIYAACKEAKCHLVIMQYPVEIWLWQVMEDFARLHPDVILVENVPLFPDPTDPKYFVPDKHCTGEGYRVIAENLFKELKASVINTDGSVRGP